GRCANRRLDARISNRTTGVERGARDASLGVGERIGRHTSEKQQERNCEGTAETTAHVVGHQTPPLRKRTIRMKPVNLRMRWARYRGPPKGERTLAAFHLNV